MPGAAWFWGALSLYGVATVLYLVFLGQAKGSVSRPAQGALLAGFIAHFLEIGARGIAGLHPVSSAGDSVGFLAWLLVGAFLITQLKRRLLAVGATVAPAALLLLVSARFASPGPGGDTTSGLGVLGRVHISLATLGVSLFAFATALAVIYLFEERQLKHKHIGRLVKKGIALETLDTLLHRCVQVGFPIFTVAIVAGAIWSGKKNGGIRPEYSVAMVAWCSFAGLLLARQAAGWRGRRAALMTLVGFSASLVVLAIYLVRHVTGG
ncbi:MAG: cytochrome c biogenesis protein CcsA [Deltaproteobacteria bacterium]|nr:cytochrome c biogenesis protein CcsA [Deltaproteobacteria bacterium]